MSGKILCTFSLFFLATALQVCAMDQSSTINQTSLSQPHDSWRKIEIRGRTGNKPYLLTYHDATIVSLLLNSQRDASNLRNKIIQFINNPKLIKKAKPELKQAIVKALDRFFPFDKIFHHLLLANVTLPIGTHEQYYLESIRIYFLMLSNSLNIPDDPQTNPTDEIDLNPVKLK